MGLRWVMGATWRRGGKVGAAGFEWEEDLPTYIAWNSKADAQSEGG